MGAKKKLHWINFIKITITRLQSMFVYVNSVLGFSISHSIFFILLLRSELELFDLILLQFIQKGKFNGL